MLRRLNRLIIILISVLVLTHCYRIPIQQGNILTETNIASIKRGMSVNQVVARLGEPVLRNIYTEKRMIYVYTFKPSIGDMTKKQLYVYFRYGRVSGTSRTPLKV